MTKRTTHGGFYVTAKTDGGTANGRTSWLLGPFTGRLGHMHALAMVTPVRRAVMRRSDDPRFAFAGFGTSKITVPVEQPLPPGRMELAWLDPGDVINASRKEPSWSSPY